MRPTLLRWLCLLVLAVSGEAGPMRTVEDGEDCNDPLVKVEQGKLRGRIMTSWKESRPFVAFQGIPYAKPPVGSLRFQPPAPLDPWNGTMDALSDASQCYQKSKGDEDCLYLNVYTPQLPGPAATPLMAVMVWIHGGSFISGSSSYATFPGDYYIEQDVVMVAMNYRLGPLGFLNLHTAVIPGNAGLKDQQKALKWVQRNIAQFGGDPRRVTIFGESAGASSVHYHILSPMSQGLFAHAISQSGSSLNKWAFSSNPEQDTYKLISKLGCVDNGTMLQCLREANVEKMIEYSTTSVPGQTNGVNVPSVESKIPGVEAFLLDTPFHLLTEGRFSAVPYLTGVNDREGILALPYYFADPDNFRKYNEHGQNFIPEYYNVSKDPSQIQSIADSIVKFYLDNITLSNETFSEYSLLLGDDVIVREVDETARVHAVVAPVYYYEFVFDGQLGLFKRGLGGGNIPGVCHADDLGYLFDSSKVRDIKLDPTAEEYKISAGFIKMWTNFAKTGNPTSELTDYVNVTWTPMEADYMHYMEIGATLRSKKDLAGPRMKFWREMKRNLSKNC